MKKVYSTEYVKKIISDNRYDIAFMIGNGVNWYGCNQMVSWKDLLKKIGDQEFNYFVADEDGNVKDGISYTEIFDALESHNLKKRMEEANWNEILELISKEVPEIKPIDSRRRAPLDGTKRKLRLLIDDHKSTKPCVFTDNEKWMIQEICYELGIDADYFIGTINDNDNELYNRLKQLDQKLSSNYLSILLSNELKVKVCNELNGWVLNDNVNNMINSILEIDSPILTTNFDLSISKKIDELRLCRMQYHFMKGGMKSEVCPWSYYFGSKTLDNPCHGFGIWHIHGIAQKPQSICLGLSDYMRLTETAWRKIHGDSFFETDVFAGKNLNNWNGYKTWLHIIFNKSLFIMGLKLEENETFLRWLLIQRSKYYALFKDRNHNGWYVYPKEEEKDKDFFGKKVFLEKVGISMIPVENYKTIYEDIWE